MKPIAGGAVLLVFLGSLAGCGGEGDGAPARPAGGGRGGFGGPGGGGFGGPGGMRPAAAVPVEVAPVERRPIAAYIETNGTLEAENEVDVVARVGAPIVELEAEEGDRVEAGQVLARLDDEQLRAQVEISRVAVAETRQSFERAQALHQQKLMSPEEYERASAAYDSARAQLDAANILLGYAVVRAPFTGLVVSRYVAAAQNVSANQALFRLSDFDPLLCPIQVPERDLGRLRKGQPAWLEVESWPGERFPARVLRISPVVEAATGTIKVTLEAISPQRLRPGMFARVFLEAEHKENALVIPKAALSLESIGDTVYVAAGSTASRREVKLGFHEGDFVEVLSGVEAGEQVVVVGQDGLSDGTPIHVLEHGAFLDPPRTAMAGEGPAPGPAGAPASGPPPGTATAEAQGAPPQGAPGAAGAWPRGDGGGRPAGMRIDPSKLTPEQLEQLKERMRERGMTEEQIEERLRRARERAAQEGD